MGGLTAGELVGYVQQEPMADAGVVVVAIWVNDTKNVNTVGVPVSLFVTDQPSFVIGGDNLASALLECKISMFFFCDAVLADVYLTTLYSLGRAMFNQ